MKYLTTFFTVLLFSQFGNAQQNEDRSYDALWKKVSQLEEGSLTKSALEMVETISKKAERENNPVQKIKALLFTSKYVLILEEDAQLGIVANFKDEIERSEPPIRNILQSYLATMYWQYFQQNRYRFYDRTRTSDKVGTDFRTWDLTTLFHEIGSLFEQSLQPEDTLKKIGIEKFDPILDQQKGSKTFRPTGYDLLAHTALEFYKTDENSITRPAYKFQLDDPEYLCPATNFTTLRIPTKDSTSLQLKTLDLYQQLIGFHLQDPSPQALVEVDLERLKYTYENASFPNADLHFVETLQNAVSHFHNNEVSALYRYEIAELYNNLANTYQPRTNEKHQWKRKEAMEICNAIIQEYPNSRAAKKSTALKAEMESRNLQLQMEAYIPLNSQSLALISYKNISRLQFTAYAITQDQQRELEKIYPIEKQRVYIKRLKMVQQWEASLTNEGDYQDHKMELPFPALPGGSYVILAEEGDTFAFGNLQVSNIALSEIRSPEEHLFQVTNRINGGAMVGARATILYSTEYNGPKKSKTVLTDSLGMIRVPLAEEQWNDVAVSITHQDDKAHFGKYYISKKYGTPVVSGTSHSAFLFTDRSIYRPGQTVYFKGIVLERKKASSVVLENQLVTVSLKDVNGEELEKQEFRTNGFGSVAGQFTLPNNGLTGQFSLQLRAKEVQLEGNAHFAVEEYKRPKFETIFTPITETYKVNDSILMAGTAMAYAGSPISNAKVGYRVRRTVQYPRWYYWGRPYLPQETQEIAHGETTTDASGNYGFSFKALPDIGSPKENLPIFLYEVTAEVTDINGETRTAVTKVKVGYHSLLATLQVPAPIKKGKTDNILSVATTNLNGQFVPAKGSIKMYKLTPPEQVLRKRPWEAPEYNGLTKEAFKKLFPHDAFQGEDDPKKWERGSLVWETDFNTEKQTEIKLNAKGQWPSGNYVIELLTKDKFGQEVKDVAHTTLYGENDKLAVDRQLFDIRTDKDTYSIGDTAILTLSSAAQNITVTVFVEKDKKLVSLQTLLLNNNKRIIKIPVREQDLGGFSVGYAFSAYNGFVSGTRNINVPYPKTHLELETVTFRDKLEPGAEAHWQFKIKGPKGEKVTAELLAGMYDASLDAFMPHSWDFDPNYRPPYYSNLHINAYQSYGVAYFNSYINNTDSPGYTPQHYDSFNWFGFYFGQGNGPIRIRGMADKPVLVGYGGQKEEMQLEKSMDDSTSNMAAAPAPQEVGPGLPDEGTSNEKIGQIQVRKNLQETAFFFPQLQTDREGNVSFGFTAPEALTKWKLQLLAHTKTLESGTSTLEAVTQKELMVTPNAPRFLREGDTIVISSKISNLTEKELVGKAQLFLEDAMNGQEITAQLIKDTISGENTFSVAPKGSTQVSWTLIIPKGLQAVQYRVIAKAGNFSDGEQNLLPVLTNRQLVTETLPMWVRGNESKSFVLKKLRDNTSTTLKNHRLTLEITSNPAWYAVQALPYLMEYPYECSEQTFARYYANSLAGHIATSDPRIEEVFSQWANADVLISNLEKNPELRSLMIQETPWLRDAQSETEQKKRIGLLFDLNNMKNERTSSLNKLRNQQMSSGAWPWFNGGHPNRFITQHIVSGLGHLTHLEVVTEKSEMDEMIAKALQYLDAEFVSEYEEMKKHAQDTDDDHLSATQIHYLYMRSFFTNFPLSKKITDITQYYKGQAKKYWSGKNLYSKGLLALFLHRKGETATAQKILRALTENSITSEEMGVYWKENTDSWQWDQAAVETQSLIIAAFSEIAPASPEKKETIDNLKIWLLKNKQTNQWKTTKATTEAVYALLLQGSDWLSVTDVVEVHIGGNRLDPKQLETVKVEAGTGYYKTSWDKTDIQPGMAKVELQKKGEGIAWGALYWQYFEDLDKIASAGSPLKVSKKLFLRKYTDTGEEISEIVKGTPLKVGDLVRVRIELRTDRTMEYIHMKDMRAAGLEPVNVLSSYKWQDGLGYYESTKDAGTHFFFDLLPKGIHVFEYDLRVGNAGGFSNGITTVQSMYAPEFGSHSEGARIEITKE